MERTLVLLKPDAIQRLLVGEILRRFERRGLKAVAMRLMRVDEPLARTHYAVHEGKPFYEDLITYITSGPVVAMALEGPDAIAVVRRTVGATGPATADPGTIRADYGLMMGRNLVHASDSAETAAAELKLWFGEEGFIDYEREVDRWILE